MNGVSAPLIAGNVESGIEEAAIGMILELPKDIEAALAFQARAAHISAEQYLAKLIERAIEHGHHMAAEQLSNHLGVMADSGASVTSTE